MSDEITPTEGKVPDESKVDLSKVEKPVSNKQDISSNKPATEPDDLWNGEPFNAKVAKERLNELRNIEKQAKKDAKELELYRQKEREREEAEMTELQKAQKQLEDLQVQNANLQRDFWRREAAAQANLPSIFADRIKGATLEEMLEDAKKLADVLPKSKQQMPTLKSTNPANGEKVETDAEKRERLFGRQGNAFDFDQIIAKGGGVMEIVTKQSKEFGEAE